MNTIVNFFSFKLKAVENCRIPYCYTVEFTSIFMKKGFVSIYAGYLFEMFLGKNTISYMHNASGCRIIIITKRFRLMENSNVMFGQIKQTHSLTRSWSVLDVAIMFSTAERQ